MVHARKKTTPRDLTHAAHAAPPSPCPSLVSVSLETSSTSHTHRSPDAVLHEAARHSQFGSDPIRVSLRPPWSIDLGRESCP